MGEEKMFAAFPHIVSFWSQQGLLDKKAKSMKVWCDRQTIVSEWNFCVKVFNEFCIFILQRDELANK